MPRVTKKEDLNERISALAKRQARDAAQDEINEGLIETETGESEVTTDDVEAQMGFDVFDYCEDFVKKGDIISYSIKKNGELLGKEYHPCSWEKISKKYGAGHYQVYARSDTTKRFIKSQTQAISGDALDTADTSNMRFKIEQPAAPVTPPDPFDGILKYATLMKELNGSSKEEAERIAERQAATQNASIMAVVEMMKASNANTQNMMMEMMKMNATTNEKIMESQNRMFEKMNDKIDRMNEDRQREPKKEKELSPIELMRMMEEAKAKGFDSFKKMSELAEAKAEEKAAAMEELIESKYSSSDKKSSTDRLIETILPSVVSALGQNRAPQSEPRRALPQRVNPTHAPRPAQYRPGVNTNPSTASHAGAHPINNQVNPNRVQPSSISQGLGLPRAATAAPKIEPSHAEVINADVKINAKPAEEQNVAEMRLEHLKLILPELTACLLQSSTSVEGSKAIQDKLAVSKVNLKNFLQIVEKDYILEAVVKYNLPKEAEPWLKEVYADLENAARVDAGQKTDGGNL